MKKSFSLPRPFPCIRITLSLGVMLALRLYGSYQSERSIVVIALLIVLEPSLCPLSLTIASPQFFPRSRVGISLEVILAPCLLLTLFLLDRPTITIFLCLMLEPSFFLLGVTTKAFACSLIFLIQAGSRRLASARSLVSSPPFPFMAASRRLLV